MDRQTTWDVLRLALMGLALAFSILLWYMKHFVDSLRDAERQSPAMRESVAQSPQILAILAGLIGVAAATWLALEVLWDSFSSGTMPIPRWSPAFWLVVICMFSPAVGAVLLASVAVSQIGGWHGLSRAVHARLVTRRSTPALLEHAKEVFAFPLLGRHVTSPHVDVSTLAAWTTSLKWVHTNEVKWQLGKTFFDVNRRTLRSIVEHYWNTDMPQKGDPASIEKLERDVAAVLSLAFAHLELVEPQILNRPLQISRAACALFLEGGPDG